MIKLIFKQMKDVMYYNKRTAYNLMFKPTGPICNLNCKYCYYLEKENLYSDHKSFKMPNDVLEATIREYIKSQDVPLVTFVWQGGESTLLGIDYFKQVLKYQEIYKGKKKIDNAFQTNGTFINDEWARFFKANDFLVGISIDGPEHIHDKYRRTKGDGPTFAKVMRGIEILKKHDVKFNTLSVVNDFNVNYPLEIYHFLKKIGSGFIQFIPIVEQIADDEAQPLKLVEPGYEGSAKVAEWSVGRAEYGKFMRTIFDEWVENDVGKYFVQLFDVSLANWVGEMPGLCVFAETCGEAAVVEHNGDVYSCDHFVYPEHYIGNVKTDNLKEMMRLPKQIKFGINKKKLLPKQCHECDVYFACTGGCPKNRIATTSDGEKGLNYLCPSYKSFFRHIKPYMDFMADELKNERPPANVMEWIRRTKAEKAQEEMKKKKQTETDTIAAISFKGVGRNEPCPCGSGKPFKNCCRNKKS